MARANLFIPAAQGLNTRLDERVRPASDLAVLTNGYQKESGAVFKRHGFTKYATTIASEPTYRPDHQGTPKGLLSTGEELLIRGHRSLYGYDSAGGGWVNRGNISPMVGSQKNIWRDQASIETCDVAIQGSYTAYAAIMAKQFDSEASPSYEQTIWFRVANSDGVSVLDVQNLTGSTQTETYPGTVVWTGARLVKAYTNRIKLFFQQSGALKTYDYSTASPTTQPSLSISDAGLPTNSNKRNFDACAMPGTASYLSIAGDTYAVAWIDTATSQVKVAVRYGDTDANLGALTLSASANGVYTCCAVTYDATNHKLFVVAGGGDAAAVRDITAWCINLSVVPAIAVTWGPTILQTNAANRYTQAVGVVTNAPTSDTVLAVWTTCNNLMQNTAGSVVAGYGYLIGRKSFNFSGTGLSAERRVFNAFAMSKPWFDPHTDDNTGGRWYMAAYSDAGADGYGGAVVLDWDLAANDSAVAPKAQKVSGAYLFGLAPTSGDHLQGETLANIYSQGNQGSLNSVVSPSTGVYQYMAPYISLKLGTTRAKLAADVVTWDTTSLAVTHGLVTKGSAIIGGGAVFWYAGRFSEELGWYSPPIIPSPSSGATTDAIIPSNTAGGTLSSSQTYAYCAVIECFDEKGNWLRSLPGPAVEVTLGAADDTVDITVRRDCLTSRLFTTNEGKGRKFGIVIYRSGPNDGGIFYRACGAAQFQTADLETITEGHYVTVFRDYGTYTGLPLYTTGGAELEAAGPDGASIVLVGTKRVWLAGFARRDRIQYSKLYNPSSGDADAIGPEFHPSFTVLIPRGKACTGLAEMDDKLIVFTTDEVYALAGNGPDDGGRNSDFSGLTTVTADTGCIDPRSVVAFPGGVIFQASSGFYLLDRSLQVSFFGQPVKADTDAYTTVTSAVLVPAQNQVRFTCRDTANTRGIVLVFDYLNKAWSRWEPKKTGGTQLDMVGACMHGGVYHVLESNGTVWKEDSTTFLDDTSVYVPLNIATSWIQATQGGLQRVRQIVALCKKHDAHDLTLKLYQDFNTSYSQTFTWDAATIASMAAPTVREQLVARVYQQKCTAFKLELVDASGTGTSTGEGYSCAGWMIEMEPKRGAVKVGSQARN